MWDPYFDEPDRDVDDYENGGITRIDENMEAMFIREYEKEHNRED